MIATEMNGLALNTNTLTFSTAYSEDERIDAGRWDRIVAAIARRKNIQVWDAQWQGTRITSSDVKDLVLARFPQFESLLKEWTTFDENADLDAADWNLPARCWGEPRSVYYGFISRALRCFYEGGLDNFEGSEKWHSEYPTPTISHLDPLPWSISTRDEIAELNEIVPFEPEPDLVNDHPDLWKYLKHGFSATAVAIRFFQSIPKATLLQMRNVVLLEDHESVAYPECHAMGLIEFCQMNPLLHIERQVSLWNNLLLAGSEYLLCVVRIVDILRSDFEDETKKELQSLEIGRSFSIWIEEALALFDNGMPSRSYTLVFDGDPLPGLSSLIFDVINEDAAWQEALDEWYKQHSITPTVKDRRKHSCYYSERFPQAVRDIVQGTSFIRCNFPIGGTSWAAKEILELNQDLVSAYEWQERWEERREALTFQTTPPLPTWIDLRLSRVLPEDERKAAKSSIVKGRDYF